MLTALPSDYGVSVQAYDIISGVSGIGRLLLGLQEDKQGTELLYGILDWIISRCTEDIASGWFTAPPQIPPEESKHMPRLVHGYVNCGLAHGLPGPLALLALSKLAGIDRPSMSHAIDKMSSWLVGVHSQDQWGGNWPTHYIHAGDAEHTVPSFQTRTAWCYGIPGVSRSLYLASRALGSRELMEFSVESLLNIRSRPLQIRNINGPSLCHGVAGLLQISLRFAHDTRLPEFVSLAEESADLLVSKFEDNSKFGFLDLETTVGPVDDYSLLTGSVGPVLALLSASTSVPPDWDNLLLLS